MERNVEEVAKKLGLSIPRIYALGRFYKAGKKVKGSDGKIRRVYTEAEIEIFRNRRKKRGPPRKEDQ